MAAPIILAMLQERQRLAKEQLASCEVDSRDAATLRAVIQEQEQLIDIIRLMYPERVPPAE